MSVFFYFYFLISQGLKKQTNQKVTPASFQSYVKLPNQFFRHFGGVGWERGTQRVCVCVEGREEL